MSLAIGIDLGTTTTCAAVFRNNRFELIPIDDDRKTLPSFIYYDSDEILVGKEAEEKALRKPSNGVFDVKRMIGVNFDDEMVQKNKLLWPFKVVEADDKTCLIEVSPNSTPKTIRPEEASAEILKKVMFAASKYLNEEIVDAVVTIPAYFTNSQREATLKAAQLANINVLKLMNEPTAAAVAFAHRHDAKDRTIFVYDIGGGTFDVSIVAFKDGIGEVKALNGDRSLGGRDFDNRLLKFVIEKFQEDGNALFQGVADEKSRRFIKRLRHECKTIKEQISSSKSSTLKLDEYSTTIEITRNDLETINDELFQKTIKLVEATLKDSPISKDQIDDIILIGGSSRIPKLKKLVSKLFGKEPLTGINQDGAVAAGAAIEANHLLRRLGEKTEFEEVALYSVQDITGVSYGIDVNFDHQMSPIIKQGSKIPVVVEKSYYTLMDFQESVCVKIYEGNGKFVKDNLLLGEFEVDGLTPALGGDVEILVKFEIDKNGIFQASATETTRYNTRSIRVNYIIPKK